MRNHDIQVYGAARCHKTRYYLNYLSQRNIPFTFLDVEENEEHAIALKKLYTNGRLNFPTLVIDGKKLRNPTDRVLEKWLQKAAQNEGT